MPTRSGPLGRKGSTTSSSAPREVNNLGQNGYRLTLGRFGNFGFEVEPTLGLESGRAAGRESV